MSDFRSSAPDQCQPLRDCGEGGWCIRPCSSLFLQEMRDMISASDANKHPEKNYFQGAIMELESSCLDNQPLGSFSYSSSSSSSSPSSSSTEEMEGLKKLDRLILSVASLEEARLLLHKLLGFSLFKGKL